MTPIVKAAPKSKTRSTRVPLPPPVCQEDSDDSQDALPARDREEGVAETFQIATQMSCGSFSSGPLSAGSEFVHPRPPLALTSLAKATELGVLTDDHWEIIGCWQAQKDRDMADGMDPISVSVNGKDFLVRHPDKAGNSQESNVHCETMMVNGADESWEEDASNPPGLCVVDTACRKTMYG